MQKAMMEPIFVQFVDQLLMIVENKDISKNWKEISDSSIIQSNWDLYLCQKFAFTRSYQDKLLFLFV
jgi:sulfatase maturation enzyme AslB (radical SAM superfamily)